MKQLLLLLVGIAFASAASVTSTTQDGYFGPGREYVYRYEGQVVSGIPDVSKEVSGIKILADTRIQMKENGKCLFKLEDVQLFKMQNETDTPFRQQPQEKLVRLETEFETPIKDQLIKQLEFRYVNGKVTDIVTSTDEPVWATNIKKGVMELMLVNIRGTDDLNVPENMRTLPTSILRQKEHYRVMEEGMAGHCQSIYNVKVSELTANIIDNQVQPSRFILNITKTRDLLDCTDRTHRSKVSFLAGRKCEKCNRDEDEEKVNQVPEPVAQPGQQTEGKEDIFKCLSQVRYSISLKDHSRFLIDTVVAEGQHIFRPFGKNGGQAITFVNQTFTLKSNMEIEDDHLIPEVQNRKGPETLGFVFQEWETHSHDPEEDSELTVEDGAHMTNIRTMVEKFLDGIYGNITEERINEDAPMQFIHLVRTLSKFSSLELQNIFDRLGHKLSDDTKEETEKKNILLDALIQVGNEKSVQILIDEITKNNLEGEQANQVLSTIALTNDPTVDMVDKVLALCKGSRLNSDRSDKQLRKTCWLTFGSLVHKACKINDICPIRKMEEYSANLLAGISTNKPEEEKRMCLKAIGNAGIVLKINAQANTDSIDKTMEIITSPFYPVDLRVQAIYSLRRLAKVEANRIIPLLMPFINDMNEHHEVRIACYVITMDAEPEEGIVLSIVTGLQSDKSRQFASFVYTHLEGLSSNYVYCKRAQYMIAKKALLALKPVVTGPQYSRRFTWSPMFYKQKMSLQSEASLIATPTSPFPVSGSVKLGATVLNRQMNIMEVGFHAKCLRDIAEKILGVAKPVRKTKELMTKLNGRIPEERTSVADTELNQLDDMLPTTKVHYDTTMVKASGYLKMFGNELRTFSVDKPTVWSYLEGTSESMIERETNLRLGKKPYTFRKIFSLGRGVHELPTELGLPLQLKFDSAGILEFNVTGKVNMTPSLTDVLAGREKMGTVDVQGEVKPKVAVSVFGKMKVSLDNVKSGLMINGGLNASTMLKGKVNVSVPTGLYKTKFDTPTKEFQAFSLRSRPYTFTMIKREQEHTNENTDVRQPMLVKRLIKGKLMNPKPVTTKYTMGKETLGVELELKTRRVPRKCSFTFGPTHLLFNGPMDLNITVRPGENAPREVLGYMQLENEFKTLEKYQEFKEHFLKKQHFSTASSSEEESQEHAHDENDMDIPVVRQPIYEQTMDMLKRFENWKYDSGKWPFGAKEEETDTTHDHTMKVNRNEDEVELYHVYFNITTNGTQPIRELVTRISFDHQAEFYKAIRMDIMTAKKSFRQSDVTNKLEEKTEEIRTWCVQGELEHPPYAVTLKKSEKLENLTGLPDVARDPKVLFKLNTQWGKSCVEDQKMQIKARVERSEKQMKNLMLNTTYKQECLKNLKENNKYTKACKTLRREREELRAVHAELTHNELVKRHYKTMFYQGMDMLKHMLWNNVETERAEVHNPDKTVLLTGELDENNRKMNVSIKHVRGNIKFNKLWIPEVVQELKVLQPYKLQQHLLLNYSQDLLTGRNINQCKALENDTILTFDKVAFNYTQSMCDHILAKDCSKKERFVVLSKKLTETGTKKVITIYLDNTKIQFMPSTVNEDIQTLINGTDVNLLNMTKLTIQDYLMRKEPIGKPKVHILDLGMEEPVMMAAGSTSHSRERKMIWSWDMPESASSEEAEMSDGEETYWEEFKDHVKMDIFEGVRPAPYRPKTQVVIVRTKINDSIMFFAPEQELKVFFDGYNVKVELPQKYKDMQCGLCGDFNGEVSDEFVGPNREVYQNPRRFGRSFQISTNECAAVDECAPIMEFPFDVEVTLPGESNLHACITKAPVPHCPSTCAPIQEENVEVEFVCIEQKGRPNPFESLSRKELLTKYGGKRGDYKRTIPMHTQCMRHH